MVGSHRAEPGRARASAGLGGPFWPCISLLWLPWGCSAVQELSVAAAGLLLQGDSCAVDGRVVHALAGERVAEERPPPLTIAAASRIGGREWWDQEDNNMKAERWGRKKQDKHHDTWDSRTW
jgi:hypothetical protein